MRIFCGNLVSCYNDSLLSDMSGRFFLLYFSVCFFFVGMITLHGDFGTKMYLWFHLHNF